MSCYRKRIATADGKIPVVAVVDDDESVRMAVQRLVCAAGMKAVQYASGEDLIDAFCRRAIQALDCIVLDLHMLGMNGLQVAESLTRHGIRIPFVFMSGADEIGMRGFGWPPDLKWICKPFDDAVLLPAIAAALERVTASRLAPI